MARDFFDFRPSGLSADQAQPFQIGTSVRRPGPLRSCLLQGCAVRDQVDDFSEEGEHESIAFQAKGENAVVRLQGEAHNLDDPASIHLGSHTVAGQADLEFLTLATLLAELWRAELDNQDARSAAPPVMTRGPSEDDKHNNQRTPSSGEVDF